MNKFVFRDFMFYPLPVMFFAGVGYGIVIYTGLWLMFGDLIARPVSGFFTLVTLTAMIFVGLELRGRYLLRRHDG